MSIDPIKAAQEIEQERTRARVQLIKELKEATEADGRLAEAGTALRRAIAQLPASAGEAATTATAAVDALRDATRNAVTSARRAATDGGWTKAQLVELGLVKAPTPRASRSDTTPTDAPPTENTTS
ncbi:hypothetical protein [Saccharopolyspora pogona]|uniref:hypothetical protein n=1 Tax=Saccharopolyspora pogona TaxID=333966 RepID=UPI0016886328|nr:hypothetical protein [Saccharopolyspora pogona]